MFSFLGQLLGFSAQMLAAYFVKKAEQAKAEQDFKMDQASFHTLIQLTLAKQQAEYSKTNPSGGWDAADKERKSHEN